MKPATASLMSERFEAAYNQIHHSLKDMVNSTSNKFTTLVRYGSHLKVIQNFQDELIQFAKLRNALVHEKHSDGSYIAEPHHDVVLRLEHVAQVLSRPQHAMTIATKPVVQFQYKDTLKHILNHVESVTYSNYPIYKGTEYIGLLTTKAIVNWMSCHLQKSTVDLSQASIQDVMTYDDERIVHFAPKASTIFEIELLFGKHQQKNKELQMIIITENGRRNEKPLGVVTYWDIVNLNYSNEKQ